MAETAVTKSAALALADERALMRQGYQFLDEKRMLVAAELLRALDRHRALEATLLEAARKAAVALRDALQRHGFEMLQAYPPGFALEAPPTTSRRLFLGVPLHVPSAAPGLRKLDDEAIDASPETQHCAAAFAALLEPLAQQAATAASLERLAAEYRRTERRARALENVLLPEVEAALKAVEEQLALADQEEGVRIRMAAARR